MCLIANELANQLNHDRQSCCIYEMFDMATCEARVLDMKKIHEGCEIHEGCTKQTHDC